MNEYIDIVQFKEDIEKINLELNTISAKVGQWAARLNSNMVELNRL